MGKNVLAVQLLERRFVIEEIHLRRTTGLEQVDHTLGLGSMMNGVIGGFLAGQQSPQSHPAKTATDGLNRAPTIHASQRGTDFIGHDLLAS